MAPALVENILSANELLYYRYRLNTGEARYTSTSYEVHFTARIPEGETDMYAKRKLNNLDTMDGEAGPILVDAPPTSTRTTATNSCQGCRLLLHR